MILHWFLFFIFLETTADRTSSSRSFGVKCLFDKFMLCGTLQRSGKINYILKLTFFYKWKKSQYKVALDTIHTNNILFSIFPNIVFPLSVSSLYYYLQPCLFIFFCVMIRVLNSRLCYFTNDMILIYFLYPYTIIPVIFYFSKVT